MSKCKGILGRLFGHKFIPDRNGDIWLCDQCVRCGELWADVKLLSHNKGKE